MTQQPQAPERFPDRPLNEAEEHWWVAKVKPRQEKLLAADFFQEGIEYYLPLYVKTLPVPVPATPVYFMFRSFPDTLPSHRTSRMPSTVRDVWSI